MHSANKVEVRDPQTVLNTGHTVGEVVTGGGTVNNSHMFIQQQHIQTCINIQDIKELSSSVDTCDMTFEPESLTRITKKKQKSRHMLVISL